ncbi:MAG: hypothetical protein AB7O59_06725 [Pirellulales bacterium]
MKRSLFTLLAVTVLASNSGCCCLERLFCWGCCGGTCPYGPAYGNEGPGGCSSCGYSGGGACADCAAVGKRSYGPQRVMSDEAVADGEEVYEGEMDGGMAPGGGMAGGPAGPRALVNKHPGNGHPLVRQRRNSGGEYEFAAGPPSGGVTYPYYTNRGPRDFLARNPRDIGP